MLKLQLQPSYVKCAKTADIVAPISSNLTIRRGRLVREQSSNEVQLVCTGG